MTTRKARPTTSPAADDPKSLRLRTEKQAAKAKKPYCHIYHHGAVCDTECRGYPTPDNRAPSELVVDASEGFIPLWAEDVTLRWRFREVSMQAFVDPDAAKAYIRDLLAQAILLWGDAVPVRFTEAEEAWDFQIDVSAQANCSPLGCTVARAFFPDAGQHELMLFPTLFELDRDEQVETMAHELGHIFGLRHFFAEVEEEAFPSEIFGTHSRFTIMNYGPDSRMTETDRTDLKALYQSVWAGVLTDINGTPIRLVRPFSALRVPPPAPAIAARA